ncbi:ABC transporter ATP-binding protein [Haloplasma contractile]|uniref:ABC-type multidrug transport system protein n=1 Tax=Haloplasma contractile SSD-17B TaxID=1033810 RepID=U2FLN4_9MOLU|nr:ATP-binding cassette domain-containing protein [Haloplasma contractile]ERJ13660.1 ABC-type multidrug transport system protein [Haloplasma contractile SSD-17B]
MIQYKNISLEFNNQTLFKHFNLTINRHEKVLLNAPSGSGKTTLMKLVLGFIKPDSGDIIVDGITMTSKTLKEIRSKIAYVSQDVDLYNQRVNELLSNILNYKVNKDLKFDELEMDKLFNVFNINHVRTKMIEELSGGERQRLGLVTALLLKRPILLLDEITSGLDKKMKEKVVSYILSLDQTMLIISHDQLWKEHDQIKVVEW